MSYGLEGHPLYKSDCLKIWTKIDFLWLKFKIRISLIFGSSMTLSFL